MAGGPLIRHKCLCYYCQCCVTGLPVLLLHMRGLMNRARSEHLRPSLTHPPPKRALAAWQSPQECTTYLERWLPRPWRRRASQVRTPVLQRKLRRTRRRPGHASGARGCNSVPWRSASDCSPASAHPMSDLDSAISHTVSVTPALPTACFSARPPLHALT